MQADNSGFLQGMPLNDRDAEEEQRTALATGTDVHHIAADTRVIRRLIERGATTVPAAVVSPRGKSGQAVQPVAAALKPRDVDRIRQAVTPQGRASATAQRDASGRFVSGGGASAATTGTLNKAVAAMARQVGALGSTLGGVGHVDPALAAAGELRNVVSPVGRGLMALHNRLAERKKERWYSRILKAITGRKGEAVAGGGDVTRGSFLGTFMGELMGNAARMLPAILAGAGGLLLKGLGLLGAFGIGQYIGGKIYEWLDKSGIATKVFDAFDAVGKWFRDKIADPIKNNVVKPVAEAMGRAQQDVAQRNGARISTGMLGRWDRAKKDLSGAASMAGVDPGIVAKVAAFESGFDPNARPRRKDGSLMSSAHGYGQFIDSTWVSTLRKYGGKYGVGGAGALSKQQALALRNDPKLQAAMLAELTRENVDLGRKLGGSNDDANVYALHNLGTGDGSRFLKALAANPGASVASILSGKVISNNKSLYADGSISVSEAYRRMESKMAAGNQFAAELAAAGSLSITASKVPAAVSVSMPSIKPAAVPMPVPDRPSVVASPSVPERLGGGDRPSVAVITREEVGQDVRSRPVAHIVTGGVGG